ncbi:MAG TPA: peptidase, partial [Bacteroidota bacterium]
MTLSTVLTILLALGSGYGASPVVIETPQEVVRLDRSSRRSWIGVSIQSLTPKLAKANGNKVDEGALINDV